MKEWKKIIIDGIETNYSVSTNGDIRNDNTNRILKQRTCNEYKRVSISLGHGNIIANVDFYNESNDDFTLFWNEINIDLLTSDGLLGNIQYTTEGLEPTLVTENDEFEFYYVFTFSSNTCTSLKYMVNTGFCEFNKDADELLENILVNELINTFEN